MIEFSRLQHQMWRKYLPPDAVVLAYKGHKKGKGATLAEAYRINGEPRAATSSDYPSKRLQELGPAADLGDYYDLQPVALDEISWVGAWRELEWKNPIRWIENKQAMLTVLPSEEDKA